jgi:hypothetical protein
MVAIGGTLTPSYDGSSKYGPASFAVVNIQCCGSESKAVSTSLAVNVAGDSPSEISP